jgi:multidrug efflux pump subunit AcrA (membrane-fusion protein)
MFLLSLSFACAIENLAAVAPAAGPGSRALQAAEGDKETPDEASSEEAKDSDEKKSDTDKTKEKPADESEQDAEEKKSEDSEKPAAKDDDKAAKETKADEKAKDEKPVEKKDAKPAAAKRKTLKIEPKRLKIDLTLDGTFVAEKMAEVPLRPETWSNYEIVEVAEHGAKVHKGEVLVKFDSEDINEAIADLELDQRLNELAILRADEELPRMEKSLKMDFADAERANKHAKIDFDRYQEIERPLTEKTAKFMVKYYDASLDYEKDELEQLEKMYEADDLTEETEEIVLKRQRSAVEFAEFSLESAKASSDEMLKIRLPRMDIAMRESLERAAIALGRAQTSLALDLNQARYEQEQRKKARKKSLDRHAKLSADRELMEIKSPADGVVFYGQAVNGKWADTQSLINKYKPHNNVSSGAILMTIVEPRPLYITAMFDEANRPDLKDDLKAKVALPAEGSDRVEGEVKSISPIPVSAGKFEIKFEVDEKQIPEWIAPGMSCKVSMTTYDKKDAVVVPKTAVHDDEYDADKHYVWIVNPDDEEAKPERRDVKLGKRKGDELEIVKGLKKDDVISLDDEDKKKKEAEKPKEEK